VKFNLLTAGRFYTKEDAEKLSSLGFEFTLSESCIKSFPPYKISGNPSIEFTSLEELINFIDRWGEIVIDGKSIIIYDDYLG
jgi:hypothetical protein